jgi:hypothetical protein
MGGIGLLTWSVTVGSEMTNPGGALTLPFVKSLGVIGLLVSMVLFLLATRHDREKKNTNVNRQTRVKSKAR